MNNAVYRRLAKRLDEIPNGFPATESGIEFRLLRKLFTTEEAALAALMRLSSESATTIASRAGVDVNEARKTLKGMVRKGLIEATRGDGELVFNLMPFVVGFYEEQLGRIDREFARLFEQYYEEVKGPIVTQSPPLHRVIPVDRAIPFHLEIFSHEGAARLIEEAKSWGVRDCICRVQQRLVGKGCDRPIKNCVMFAPREDVFRDTDVTTRITKEEALRLLHEAAESGLVHTTGNYRDNNSYICNCCTCCCGILRAVAASDSPTKAAASDFLTDVDLEACVGCGSCIEHCQFNALTLADHHCIVDRNRCVGCGLCTISCLEGALSLTRRPQEECSVVPATSDEWRAERAKSRNIALDDIL